MFSREKLGKQYSAKKNRLKKTKTKWFSSKACRKCLGLIISQCSKWNKQIKNLSKQNKSIKNDVPFMGS